MEWKCAGKIHKVIQSVLFTVGPSVSLENIWKPAASWIVSTSLTIVHRFVNLSGGSLSTILGMQLYCGIEVRVQE